jgi:hypothetical protein
MITVQTENAGSALKYHLLAAGCLRQVTRSSLNLLNKVSVKGSRIELPSRSRPITVPIVVVFTQFDKLVSRMKENLLKLQELLSHLSGPISVRLPYTF